MTTVKLNCSTGFKLQFRHPLLARNLATLLSTMDLASRLTIEYANNDADEPVTSRTANTVMIIDDGEDQWLETPPWATRWKRLVTMLKIVMLHALTGSLLSTLENVRQRLITEALEVYQRLSGGQPPNSGRSSSSTESGGAGFAAATPAYSSVQVRMCLSGFCGMPLK